MEPKIDKRIVSKGEYAKAQGKRASKGLLGTGLYVASIVCGLMAFFMIFVLGYAVKFYREEPASSDIRGLAACLGTLFAFCAVSWFFRKSALRIIKQAKEMETGVPLTRANTADLPVPESLVRASEEPIQAQEAVLLRAAAEGQETPPEQLVRAVGGQE